MNRFLILISSIIIAWIIHVVFVTNYMRKFINTHSLIFRIVYALELATTFGIMLAIYLSKVSNPARLGLIIVTTIGFLAIVDTILALTQKNIRNSFDGYHFIVAYIVTGVVMTILYKFKT